MSVLDQSAVSLLGEYASAFARAGGGRRHAAAYMTSVLRLALKWRSQQAADLLMARHGRRVLGGPFAGMDYTSEASEGALCPRLLGTYESELHPELQRLAAAGVTRIADVGCAEGYYAVGLARLMPEARVEAYDVDPVARSVCRELARRNGVADRVQVREGFDVRRLGEVGPGTLVFMDVEGAEAELLGPEAPAILRRADLIVETHPGMTEGVTETLQARFTATHEVETIFEAPKRVPEGAFAGPLLTLDEFVATWEWRATPTPWLVMRPRGSA